MPLTEATRRRRWLKGEEDNGHSADAEEQMEDLREQIYDLSARCENLEKSLEAQSSRIAKLFDYAARVSTDIVSIGNTVGVWRSFFAAEWEKKHS